MHEELLNKLLYIAKHEGISIQEIKGGPEDPDVAFCIDNIINLNYNYQTKISVAFRLAHEISHIKFSNPSFLYTFSPYIRNKEERITNENAIRMLAKLMYEDTPNEFRNWLSFIEEFNLPSWFEPLVKDVIYE